MNYNQKQRPIMIHRVCFGSIERFIGILTESLPLNDFISTITAELQSRS